jgi:hypothetical protein
MRVRLPPRPRFSRQDMAGQSVPGNQLVMARTRSPRHAWRRDIAARKADADSTGHHRHRLRVRPDQPRSGYRRIRMWRNLALSRPSGCDALDVGDERRAHRAVTYFSPAVRARATNSPTTRLAIPSPCRSGATAKPISATLSAGGAFTPPKPTQGPVVIKEQMGTPLRWHTILRRRVRQQDRLGKPRPSLHHCDAESLREHVISLDQWLDPRPTHRLDTHQRTLA